MRSMPSAMPHSVAPTMIDCATRCSVSMLEPHWRLRVEAADLGGRPARRATVSAPMPASSPAPADVAQADVLDHVVG